MPSKRPNCRFSVSDVSQTYHSEHVEEEWLVASSDHTDHKFPATHNIPRLRNYIVVSNPSYAVYTHAIFALTPCGWPKNGENIKACAVTPELLPSLHFWRW